MHDIARARLIIFWSQGYYYICFQITGIYNITGTNFSSLVYVLYQSWCFLRIILFSHDQLMDFGNGACQKFEISGIGRNTMGVIAEKAVAV